MLAPLPPKLTSVLLLLDLFLAIPIPTGADFCGERGLA